MAEPTEKKVKVKLPVDTKYNVVLFAEAGKDFIDFLFHILSMPVGAVVRLIGKSGMVGSLGNLYDSIEKLDDTYCIKPSSSFGYSDVKNRLLKPRIPSYSGTTEKSGDITPALLPREPISYDDSQNVAYYRCPPTNYSTCCYVSLNPSATCPNCEDVMSKLMTLVDVPARQVLVVAPESEGYVKGVMTYMVMDDLSVSTMSNISCITLLDKFKVAHLSCLGEKVIELGTNEGLALLKASFQSKTVLTDVFLKGKK
ncbi:hypothetical protein SAY86_009547 [Trapa natans]|uniref:DUF674 domain-containing protein n=1 Tax=Trapa natans TaxID=22666 RepID=A0AAN7KW68_TRANT|nr:hypothetical protein SAY86_009547 [Trapa natans]